MKWYPPPNTKNISVVVDTYHAQLYAGGREVFFSAINTDNEEVEYIDEVGQIKMRPSNLKDKIDHIRRNNPQTLAPTALAGWLVQHQDDVGVVAFLSRYNGKKIIFASPIMQGEGFHAVTLQQGAGLCVPAHRWGCDFVGLDFVPMNTPNIGEYRLAMSVALEPKPEPRPVRHIRRH